MYRESVGIEVAGGEFPYAETQDDPHVNERQ